MTSSCVFAQRSLHPCGPKRSLNHPLQTLDEIDASSLNGPPDKRSTRISWMILSRAGINYLSNSDYYGKWVICYNHRREFLDSWQLSKACCYPNHDTSSEKEEEEAKNMVTLVMAVRVLQKERRVMPISGRICDDCKTIYDESYPPTTSGNVVVVIPRNIQPLPHDNLLRPSPFSVPENDEIDEDQQQQHNSQPVVILRQDASNPILTMKTEVLDPGDEEITIKQEEEIVTSSVVVAANNDDEEEDEEDNSESLFSDDSDDDRTWAPEKKKSSSSSPNKRARLTLSDDDDDEVVPPMRKKKMVLTTTDTALSSSEKHFFCKICKITFYKQASYRQHVRSSREIHKEVEKQRRKQQKDEEEEDETDLECSECCIAFNDRTSQSNHMQSVHKKPSAFYCEMCKVHMKNESAFKSHNSKLHLERRERTYYCRECDETFRCKAEHGRHIVTHRLWSGQEPGFQCATCGKVFTGKQKVPYQRHMATHDAEPNMECACTKCAAIANGRENQSPEKPSKDKDSPMANLLKKMQNNFTSPNNDDDDDEATEDEEDVEILAETPNPFQCALCRAAKFQTPADLESHVHLVHQKVAAKDDDDDSSKLPPPKRVFSTNAAVAKDVRSSSSISAGDRSVGQDGLDRNWAAEFGYGGKNSSNASRLKSGDLLSKMKLKFKLAEEDEEEAEEEEVEKEKDAASVDDDDDDCRLFRTRGFKGTVKASPKKSPRTLSNSSLTTRKRMESLIKRAREHQESVRKNKLAAAASAAAAATKTGDDNNGKSVVVVPAEDDDDFEGFEDEDESLLIPMANGWVCEKKPRKSKGYRTVFWSPDGERFTDLDEIKSHLREKRQQSSKEVDMAAFEKAVRKNPSKVSEQNALSNVVDSIIDDEEEDDDDDDDEDDSEEEEEINTSSASANSLGRVSSSPVKA